MGRKCFQPNKTRDITGCRFGNLTAIRFDHRDERVKGGPHYWIFRCDCGKEIVARKNAVTSGNTKRCVDCSNQLSSKRNTTHGLTNTRLYKEWAGMIQRCENQSSTSWSRYGANGVSVCTEWHRFESFKDWAFENGYTDEMTIDRIDSNGNYEPSNCRWSTVREQANNKNKTIWITYNGERLPLSYWSDRLKIKYHTLYDRLFLHNWTVEKAFTTPTRRY